jgi:hypothetical protein
MTGDVLNDSAFSRKPHSRKEMRCQQMWTLKQKLIFYKSVAVQQQFVWADFTTCRGLRRVFLLNLAGFCKNLNRIFAAFNDVLVNYDLANAVKCRQIEHGIKQNGFQD